MKQFMEYGGTEMAPISTTSSQRVAFQYAQSEVPLIFNFVSRGLCRGCNIEFLSLYPKERETLFPPLTFLQPEYVSTESGTVVVHVTPQI